jgi:hypothetical protein
VTVFVVEGYIDSVSYAVQVGGDTADAVLDPRAERAGAVVGSPSAISVLSLHEGRDVLVTPVGPAVVGSVTDPAGILGVLYAHTEVTSVSGDDVPDLGLAPEPGTVQ